jgi:ADP-ribose pyrophosphatase YjhB (NUDIX family)
MVRYEPSYCPDCGSELGTKEIHDRERHYCHDCEKAIWLNAVPLVYPIVVDTEADPARVLLVLHRKAQQWDVPGGHPEREEAPRVAAVRELEEETGLTIPAEELSIFDVLNRKHPNGSHQWATYFTAPASVASGTVQAGDDADETAWFTAAELTESEELLPRVAEIAGRALRAYQIQ